jgi:glycosyltransferase involved in cell wall biosynthesis
MSERGLMKTALMICYHFPPVAASGVYRSLYFAKHLPSFGYKPVVVHGVKSPRGEIVDNGLLAELPAEVKMVPFPAVEPACWTRPIEKRLKRLGRIGERLCWRIRTATEAVERRMSPDASLFWARRLIRPLLEVIKRENVAILYSTSDPFSDHYLAWQLKQHTGLPWVADFRDLWTQDWTYSPAPASRVRRDLAYEQHFLHEADAVVSVSPGYTSALRGLAPTRPDSRFHVITNGFEPSAVPSQKDVRRNRFVISFIGVLYQSQWSDAFLLAIQRLNHEVGAHRGIEWHVAGRMNRHCLDLCKSLGDSFKYLGHLDHVDAVAKSRESDALLLQVLKGKNAEGNIPSKLFEYLATGRPVLCLSSVRGDATRIIEDTRGGVVVEIDSEDQIYLALRRLYAAWKSNNAVRGACPTTLTQYERRSLTGQLASVFNELTLQRNEQRPHCEPASIEAIR